MGIWVASAQVRETPNAGGRGASLPTSGKWVGYMASYRCGGASRETRSRAWLPLNGDALDEPLNQTFRRRRRLALEDPGRLWTLGR